MTFQRYGTSLALSGLFAKQRFFYICRPSKVVSLRALENVSGKADASNPQGAEVTKDSSFFFCVLLLRPYRLLYRQSMTKLKRTILTTKHQSLSMTLTLMRHQHCTYILCWIHTNTVIDRAVVIDHSVIVFLRVIDDFSKS